RRGGAGADPGEARPRHRRASGRGDHPPQRACPRPRPARARRGSRTPRRRSRYLCASARRRPRTGLSRPCRDGSRGRAVVKFDASMPGTPEQAWLAEDRLADRPAVQLDLHDELVVVAAHPDDETFGAGLLIAEAAKRGMRVRVVVVTDGAAARTETDDLVAVRCDETTEAVATLASHAEIEFLAFPDGQTREHRREITGELRHILQDTGPQALLAAPWRGDGHRDHRIVGEI